MAPTRYEPPETPRPLNDRINIDDPETIGTVYEILCDASMKSGDSITFCGPSFEVLWVREDTERTTVYEVKSNASSNTKVDHLILNHNDESVIWRHRDHDRRQQELLESDSELESDVYVRRMLLEELDLK